MREVRVSRCRRLTLVAVLACATAAGADKHHATAVAGAGIDVPSVRDRLQRPPLAVEDYARALAEFRAGLPAGVRADVGRVLVAGVVDLSGRAPFLGCLGAAQGRFQTLASRLEAKYLAPTDRRRPGYPSLTTSQLPAVDVYAAAETAEALSYVELASRACGDGVLGEQGEDFFHLEPPAGSAGSGITSADDVANYTHCLEARATWAQERCGGPAAAGDGGAPGGRTARDQGRQLVKDVALWTLKTVVKAGIGAALPDVNPYDPETQPEEYAEWESEHQEERIALDNELEEIAAAIANSIFDWIFGPEDQEECAPGYSFAAAHPLAGATYAMGGVSLGAGEMLQGCVCHLSVTHLGESNPLTPWDCKSAAEQRRDCARNPYTPDDAPRPECIGFLYEDADASPPTECVNALCPATYEIDDPDLCTCRAATLQAGTPPQSLPVNPNACSQVVCPDGADATPTAGGCLCQMETGLPERPMRDAPAEPGGNPGVDGAGGGA